MATPDFLKEAVSINKIIKPKTVNFAFLASNCFKPSRFRYFTRETIKNARSKTINKNITGTDWGSGEISFPFLNISIKEPNMPPLTVVGKP